MPKSTVERRIDGRISGAPAVVSGGGSGGGGGGVTDHGALSGLNDDDHPQYLTSARGDALFLTPAEGNAAYVPLARTVSAGDGMSGGGALSANIALAVDATVVRTTRQVLAGNGLTGGGTLAADRTVTLGTPGDVTATTTSGVTSTSHVHGVVNSSDVHLGESVLLSSTAGKLRLENIEVGWSASAQPVLITNDTPNMERVGILCQPDPQFALDVAGPMRAQLFVGPHAIQLKNALLIAHYDGALPFAKNFSGEPNGHMGQSATVSGTVLYRPGKFGKALQVAPATINYALNPSFEVDTNNWTIVTSSSYSRILYPSAVGDYCLLLGASSPGTSYILNDSLVTVANGETISCQARVHRFYAAYPASIYVRVAGLGSVNAVTVSGAITDEWELITTSWTNTTGSSKVCGVMVGNNAGNGTTNILIDAVQVEKGVLTPYHDGSMTPTSSWSGTAHASASSRATGYLSYPTAGNVNPYAGTVMAWVNLAGYSSAQGYAIAAWGATGAGQRQEIFIHSNGTLLANINGAYGPGVNVVTENLVGKWVHVASTWDAATGVARFYVNGAQVGADVAFGAAPATLAGTLTVGYMPAVPSWGWNGAIDDLAITGQAMTANEIRAVYESNAPVFAESSVWSFRATPKGLVWADENGLWMRNADGDAVFGAYGGEGDTYAWGGHVLHSGDVIIGRDDDAVWWDSVVNTLYIGGTLYACDGIFTGSLSAATGTFAGSLTAASGNISGTLAISGAGKITAGSNVTLDATNGLTLKPLAAFSVSAAVGFVNAAGNIGFINANQNGTSSGALYIESQYVGSAGAGPQVRLRAGASSPAEFILEKSIAGLVTASLNCVLILPNNTASVPALTGTRTNSGVFFVAGASSAAAQVAVSVDGVLQVEVNKGFTKFGGTVVGSTTAAASASAYVYANGRAATPGFEQTTGGGVVLRAPAAQTVSVQINASNIFTANETYVDMSVPFQNLRVSNDPGAQGTGIVALTNTWGGAGSGICTIKSRTSSATNSVGFIKIIRESGAYGIPVVAW